MPSPEFSVAGHLRKVPLAVRPTVLAARRTVKAVAPKAKALRFITLNAPADAERPAVKRVVRMAFALGGSPPSERSR